MKELNEMTVKELENLKRTLYKDNTENGNIHKLYTIARMLGEEVKHSYGPKYLYKYGENEIYVDDYGHYMTVRASGQLVVSTHTDKLYVPGEWESVLTEAHPLAEEKLQRQSNAEEQKAKSDLLAQLGSYFKPL